MKYGVKRVYKVVPVPGDDDVAADRFQELAEEGWLLIAVDQGRSYWAKVLIEGQDYNELRAY